MADVASEGFVQTSCLLFESSDFDLDSGGRSCSNPLPLTLGLGSAIEATTR